MFRRPIYTACIFVFFSLGRIYAQCPSASFSLPATACKQELVSLQSNSLNSISNEWLLCSNDYVSNPAFNKIVSSINGTPVGSVYFSKFIQVNGVTFLYFISNTNNKLVGLRITDLATMTFVIHTEIDISTIIPGAAGFDIINENGTWVGMIAKITSPFSLVRVTFNSTLTSIISSSDLSSAAILSSPWDIKILNDNGQYFVFISNQTGALNQQIIRLSFGSSLSNTPVASYIAVPAGTQAASLDFYDSCNEWTGFLTSRGGKILRFDFGSSLINTPTTTELSLGITLNDPGGLALIQEHDQFLLLSQSRNGFFYSLNLGSSINNNTPVVTSHGNFKSTNRDWDIEVLRVGSKYIMVTSNFNAGGVGGIYSLAFAQSCPASISYSQNDVEDFYFLTAGTHKVTLSSSNAVGDKNRQTHLISVNSIVAPQVTIAASDVWCINSTIGFNFISDLPISSTEWKFGDAQTSSQTNPQHVYTSSGSFVVDLEVQAANGCKNRTDKNIQIYEQPNPLFEQPVVTPICSNNEYIFVNQTIDIYNGNLSYQWSVNNQPVSNDRDLNYIFKNITSHVVSLEAIIPGCSDRLDQTINTLVEGPQVDFTFLGQCQNESVTFTNQSSGDITSYNWTFNDGQTSAAENPTHSFSAPGNYDVTLQANSPNGCQNTNTKPVTIYSKPQPNFSLALPPFSCSGSTSRFTDTTPNPSDSNLSSWQWNFGDPANSSSAMRNPQFVYNDAGDYTVSLTVSTNFGCADTFQKKVTIAQTPLVTIENTPSCIGKAVTFSGATSSTINNWSWQIGNTFYTTAEPVYLFSDDGNYNVSMNAVGSNGCLTSADKVVYVPPVLSPDFSWKKNCVDHATAFQSNTQDQVDPVVKYDWNYAGLGVGEGDFSTFTFPTTGIYDVGLKVTTTTGCDYLKTKSVTITPAPVANFTATPASGAPPLKVQFTNQSSGATSYLWSFNDKTNATSVEVSPQFTFTDISNYVVDLTAYNLQECSTTLSKIIEVQVPANDVALNAFQITEAGNGFYKGTLVVHNKGNITVSNLPVVVEINGIQVQEKIPGPLFPGLYSQYELSFEIVKKNNAGFVCATLVMPDDIFPGDNKACVGFSNETFLYAPSPNPANNQLTIQWITEGEIESFISIVDAMGKENYRTQITSKSGLNTTTIDTSLLSGGIYYVLFTSGNLKRTSKVMVAH